MTTLLSNRINVFCKRFLRYRMRRRWQALGGGPASIFSNNCLAGLIYHDFGLRFDSPTINLWMSLPEFVAFMEHLDESLTTTIGAVPDAGQPYPVGRIVVGPPKTVVTLHFSHYRDFDSAVAAWRTRARRVDRKRLVIVAAENAPCSEEELLRFQRLPFPKLLFTRSQNTADVLGPDAFLVHSFSGEAFNVTDFCDLLGFRYYHQLDVPKTLLVLLEKQMSYYS